MAYVREDLDSPKKLAALADAVDSAGSGSNDPILAGMAEYIARVNENEDTEFTTLAELLDYMMDLLTSGTASGGGGVS